MRKIIIAIAILSFIIVGIGLGIGNEVIVTEDTSDLDYRALSNGLVEYSFRDEGGQIGFYIEGDLGLISTKKSYDEFNWTWEKQGNQLIGRNNDNLFNWTQTWSFGERGTKITHEIKNNLGLELVNPKFYYVIIPDTDKFIIEKENNQIDFYDFEIDFNDLAKKLDEEGNLLESEFRIKNILLIDGKIIVEVEGNNILSGFSVTLDPEITPYKSPSACNQGTQQWTNCSNTFVSDNARASETTFNEVMHAHNFSIFAEDDFSTIRVNGIEISVEARSAPGFCAAGRQADISVDWNYNLDGGAGPETRSTNSYINTFGCTETTLIYGGLSDQWGEILSLFNINDFKNNNFAVKLNFSDDQGGTGGSANVDQIRVRLNYTLIYGNPPNINLNAPTNNSVITTRNAVLNWSVSDIENNTIRTDVFGSSDSNKINESVLFRNYTQRGNGTILFEQIFNWSVPPLIKDNNTVLIYHLDNQTIWGENNDPDGFIRDFSFSGNDGEPSTSNSQFNHTFGILGGGMEYYSSAGIGIAVADGNGTKWGKLCVNGCSFSGWGNKKTELTTAFIISRSDGSTKDFLRFGYSANRSTFSLTDDGSGLCTVTGTNNILFNEWHLYTGTWENSTGNLSVYLDGKIENSTTCSFTSVNETAWETKDQQIWVSDWDGAAGRAFVGTIDEIGIWNKTLTSKEINELYQLKPDTTYYWNINATDGNSTNFNGTRQFRVSSCLYSGGNWNIKREDSCVINSNINGNSGANMTVSGAGNLTINSVEITGFYDYIFKKDCSGNTCDDFIISGGSLG
ncbi:LamG domain-containing protein [Candidatus Pacearchaeota archaeon]|nr:LamG domain-containing protein [Candidatus Pacearchaeota archaeon]